ncbi:hypothetical protein B0T18DRAFT_385077 [Schizothecium vesticola]|uniref:Uncharacterized protein n=1 Tax=Schizothecium vesticola TaxID=314040 RepID=A0AA40F892_9PEZI|nr:hypothetical protein B0T18DRAFT_385077 [Schizothecium vesticola]
MTPPTTRLVTDDEIKLAPDDVVRAALIVLCRNDAALRARKKRKADEDGEAANEQELPEARRQKLEGLRVCIMCEKAYLETENRGEVCWHHPEKPEIEKEAKVWQHFEEHHGDMDTPQNRKDTPEAFGYPCCCNDLTSAGCRWGRHNATVEERDSDPERKDDSE